MTDKPRNESSLKLTRRNKIWIDCASCSLAFKADIENFEGKKELLLDCDRCGFENVVTVTIRVKRS